MRNYRSQWNLQTNQAPGKKKSKIQRLHARLGLSLEPLERRLMLTAMPAVVSINRDLPLGQNTSASTVSYSVIFNESVTHVDSSDFRVITSGTVAATTAVAVSGSGSVYTVSVSGIHDNGDLQLDLIDDDSIVDGSNVHLGGMGPNNGSFQGQSYTVDQIYPSVQSINRANPVDPITSLTTVSYTVTFNEPVIGIDESNPNHDFALATSSGITGASITSVSGSGSVYTVAISGISGNGSLGLNFTDDGSVRDLASHPLTSNDAPFPTHGGHPLPTGSAPSSVTVSDVNGDGKSDLVAANAGGASVSVLLGNGDGTFQNQTTFATGLSPSSVAVMDVNGDGRPDLVVANSGDNNVSVLLGNGDGTFQNQTTFATGSAPSFVAVADLNGDGKPDLIVADSGGVSLLLGNGDGTFQSQTTFATGSSPSSVVVADVNGDGKPDLVVANGGDNNVGVLLGNGNGTFQNQTTLDGGSYASSVAVGDVNGDGKPDLVVANTFDNGVGVLLGNGNGTFQNQTTFAAGLDPSSVAVADINGDDKPDLVVANNFGNGVSVLMGNGDGTFQSQILLNTAEGASSVVVADFNADGRPDLIVGNSFASSLRLVLGNKGNFTGESYTRGDYSPFVQSINRANPATVAANGPSVSYTVTFSKDVTGVDELNPNHDFTLVTTGGISGAAITSVSGSGSVYTVTISGITGSGTLGLNLVDDGSIRDLGGNRLAEFQAPTAFATGQDPYSVAVADVNRDGKPDLVAANYFNTTSVLLGNGDGTFQNQATYNTGSSHSSVSVADVNGDGKSDLVVSTADSLTVKVLLGNGDGTFQNPTTFATGGGPYSVAVADVNRDGKLDLVVVNDDDNSVSVLLGNGDGTFQSQTTFATGSSPYSVAVADVNGDGKPDLVVANSSSVSVLLGNGDGTFQNQAIIGFFGSGTCSVAVADVNRDGKPDLVVAIGYSNILNVLLGNGDGTFQDPTTFATGSSSFASSVAVADVNSDGKLDLIVANDGGVSLLLGNGDGTFQNQATFANGLYSTADSYSVAVADVNRDGKPDVIVAKEDNGSTVSVLLNSANGNFTGQAYRILGPPNVDLNGGAAGTGFSSQWSGSAPVVITDAANAMIVDDGTTLAWMTVTLTSPATGDVLAASTTGTSITQSYSAGTLTLSGVDTLADYQSVLRTVTYNNMAGGPGAVVETASITANDGTFTSTAVTSTINMPAPSLSLTAGAGSGAPNYTTSWYNQGSIPTENNVLATVTALSGVTTLSSIKVTLATFHTGDVLALAPLGGVSLALTSSYSAGTLTLSGTDTVAHYQQALRFISYNNTVGGPGATPIVATFVANDGTLTSAPVTSTINISVGSGQVLGNRLFYNNSKYDGNNVAIGTADDAAIASDKTGYTGTGTATFANVSAFNKGITGIMVDLQNGIGNHSAINLTSGDITFKVSPASFVTTTYNQLSTWSAAPSPSAISVRMGAGQGGSDRLEITFATGAIKNEWIEVDVHTGGNMGLSAADVFYFGSVIGDSGAADTALLAKTDGNDYNVPFNNIVGLTTPVWNLADYTKDGKVDGNDATTAISNVFTLHYLANPTGPFAPNGGGSATPAASPAAATPAASALSTTGPLASATGTIMSGLSFLNSGALNYSPIYNALQHVISSPPVTKAIQTVLHDPQLLQVVEQVASQFNLHDDALDGLLADLGLE